MSFDSSNPPPANRLSDVEEGEIDEEIYTTTSSNDNDNKSSNVLTKETDTVKAATTTDNSKQTIAATYGATPSPLSSTNISTLNDNNQKEGSIGEIEKSE